MARLTCAFAAFLVLVTASGADVLTFTFDYPEPVISQVGEAHHLGIPGCMSIGQAGEPRLPVQGITALLPPGHSVASVQVEAAEAVVLPGAYQVEVTQRQYPFSYQGPWEVTPLSPDLVGSSVPFPSYRAANPATSFMTGCGLGSFTLHPVAYTPATGEVRYFPRLTVHITTETTGEASEALATMYRGTEQHRARLANAVINPSAMLSYPSERMVRDTPYDLLIVTSNGLQANLNQYVNYKTVRGWRIAVETVESIYAAYTGVDNPDKIRNCIKDYYTNNGIQYVMLGGDNETVPHRGLYNDPGWGYEDDDVAADLYFAGLDGNWNTDGDGLWGENNLESDLVAEVFVARVCADNALEFTNFYNKTVAYQSNPIVAECTEALMVGELLWSDPTYGGDYKDEIKFGASTHGYTTVGFPPNFDVATLYDRDLGTWNAMSQLRPLLNNGVHLVNHLGHADVTYYMRLYNSDLTDANFTNNGVNHSFYITYSQGCYCGSFDNRTTSGGYTSDCINERIAFELAHGAVADVACSRYGWGAHSSTNGSSQYYDRQFFDALFGEGITNIAEINQDSKEDNIPYIGFEQNRWCYYELNVLGDPLLDIWTAQPAMMVVNHAAAYVIGEATFTVSVPGVAGARVAFSRDGALLGSGLTDGAGTAIIEFDTPPQTPGPMDLYVTAHDRLEHHGTVEVISPSGPYVVSIAHDVDDDMAGGSFGDDDGEVELGETIQFGVQLKNVGVDPAPSVSATASSASPYVQFTQNTQSYGNMPAGAEVWSPGDYVFSISGNCPDRQGVSILMHATSGANSWDSYRSLLVNAPVLALSGFTVTEVSGNGNGKPDAGETVQITPALVNNGHGTAWNIAATLATADGYTNVTTPASVYPNLAPEASSGCSSPFVAAFSASTPLAHLVTFTLNVSAAGGYTASAGFTICIGQKPLLFVDTDDEVTETRITQALNGLGETYDTWQWFTAGSPGLQELMKYEVVLWASGDQNQSTSNAQDRSDLGAYLDNGGRLLFSAENYLSSYAGDSFTSQYLHVATYDNTLTGVTSVIGTAGDPIGDGLQVAISLPSGLADTPDTIGPDPSAARVFRMANNGKSTVIRYPATGEAAYRMIFFATPLEAFSATGTGDNTITGVIARSLAWLRGSSGDIQSPTSPSWAGMDGGGTLSWAPATDNVGVTGYRIYRSADGYFDVSSMAPFATTTGTVWTLTEGIGDPNLNYFYAVTAVDDAANESMPSPTVGEHDYVVEQ
ncbi:MAG: C25 family cysteine peptidase [Candidatus Eisenbacteria bacterium]|nr:C25 family cysteine peptidase [Candidatus Eisenbacteria bacterium]